MKNKYEVRGEVTAIFLNSPKHGNRETLISTSQLPRMEEFPNTWFLHKGTRSFYVRGNIVKDNGKKEMALLHRWITDASGDYEVDHLDHETLNNVDSNLRVLTVAENQQNRKSSQSNSKSGIRGVTWHISKKIWIAKIQINKKSMHIGCFKTIEEAEIAVVEARKTYMPFSIETLTL
jgi:hypothetical protein